MATIHYKGPKKKMPVYFPVGVLNKTGIKETKWAAPDLEMTQEEAEKLVALDSQNFEIVSAQLEPVAEVAEEIDVHLPKHGRLKKGKK